jgi:hypothetical protein
MLLGKTHLRAGRALLHRLPHLGGHAHPRHGVHHLLSWHASGAELCRGLVERSGLRLHTTDHVLHHRGWEVAALHLVGTEAVHLVAGDEGGIHALGGALLHEMAVLHLKLVVGIGRPIGLHEQIGRIGITLHHADVSGLLRLLLLLAGLGGPEEGCARHGEHRGRLSQHVWIARQVEAHDDRESKLVADQSGRW